MPKKKSNKGLKAVFAIVVIIILCAVGYFSYSYVSNDINGNQAKTKDYTLIIKSGDSQYDVSQKLVQNKIVISDSLWSNWMDKHYPDFVYTAGEYYITDNMSYSALAEKLTSPDIAHEAVSVVIPEGYNIFDIAQRLEENGVCKKSDFLNACKSTDGYDYSFVEEIPSKDTIAYPLEGFLFPATYDLEENMKAREVVDTMLSAFADRISDSWRTYCNDNDMTLYELITLSSVVEKETLGKGVAQNIASVFINRLNKGQKLQSDVTIDYGNELRANGFSDKIVTSYNTYKCQKLPSGPICNPGVENIDAVVNHNDTNYFYFFSYNNGADFYFTDDYSDFSAQWAKLKHTNTN